MNDKTDKLLASRRATYGDRIQNMIDIATIWSTLLGVEIQPWQVPLMMSAVKFHRLFQTPDYSDSVDDVDGWMKIFREVMGEDMINARTVEEYLARKEQRELNKFKPQQRIMDDSHLSQERIDGASRHPYENIVEEF